MIAPHLPSVDDPAANHPVGDRLTTANALARGLVSLPDRMLTGFLVVSIAVTVPLLLDQFRPWIVLPLAVLGVILTRRLVPASPRVNTAAVVGTAIALVITLLWCLIHVPMYSEVMGVSRDPGQYTLFGFYLIDHPTGEVHLSQAVVDLARTVPGVSSDWNGDPPTDQVPVQGTNLIPALIGMFGWLFGPIGALKMLVAVAGLALFGLYAVARRLLGPLWGLLPVLALATAMPLAAFGRVPYTEPSSLLFFCGTVVGLWAGVRQHSKPMILLAGLFAGASMMARLDGVLAPIGGLLGLVLVHLMGTPRTQRRETAWWLRFFLLGSIVTGGLGLLDVIIHSPFYVEDQAERLWPLLVVIPVLFGLAKLLGWTGVLDRLAGWSVRRARRLAAVLVVLVAVILLGLASRPLWLVSRLMYDDYQRAVQARQQIENLPMDGAHSYDEWTVNWHAWYFGWAIVVASGVGLLIVLWRAVVRRHRALVLVVTVPATAAALYLNAASITPDQVWAMRRMLPGVIPGVLLMAAVAFREVAVRGVRVLAKLLRRDRDDLVVRWWRPAVGVAAVVVFAAPVTFWGELFDVREGAGEYQFTQAICGQVPDGARLVIAGDNPPFGHFLPTAQQVCGLDAVRVASPNRTLLAAVADQWSDAPIVVVTFSENVDGLVWTAQPHQPMVLQYQRWEEKLMRTPVQAVNQTATAWLGVLKGDGTLTPQ